MSLKEASLGSFVISNRILLSLSRFRKRAFLNLGLSLEPGEQERGLKLKLRIISVSMSHLF